MDAKTGVTFLSVLFVNKLIDVDDLHEAAKIASEKSPSSAFDVASLHIRVNTKCSEMQKITYAKGVRWLAMLRRDEGDEIFSLSVLQLAVTYAPNDIERFMATLAHGEVRDAARFSKIHHGMQMRVGGEMYFLHVLRVGLAVANHYSQRNRPEMIVKGFKAGVGHDLIEDTYAKEDEVRKVFGDDATNAIMAVTHESEEETDEVYLARVTVGGELAILVKRYDKLDNIASLAKADAKFREKKLAESWESLPIWRRIDPEGAHMIETALRNYS